MKYILLASFMSLLFSGCVVKEEGYHHHHHDRVYVEER
jgi:hypothetical protein